MYVCMYIYIYCLGKLRYIETEMIGVLKYRIITAYILGS